MFKNIIVTLAAAVTFVVPSLALASDAGASSQGEAAAQQKMVSRSHRVRLNRVAKADEKKVEAKTEKKSVKVRKSGVKGSTQSNGANTGSSQTTAAPATAN